MLKALQSSIIQSKISQKMDKNLTTISKDLGKAEKYELLTKQVKSFLEDENDLIANMANVTALIKTTFDFHWVGFYRVIDKELILGPFQGPIACTRIAIPNGVCGKCVQDKETVIVPDVHQFPGHIACSTFSNSEIVLPHLKNGEVDWILDIDSINFDDFDFTDKENLERIIQLF